MRYNTRNPIGQDGSEDPRDFHDNVANADLALNSEENSWVDRLGKARKTFKGMEGEFYLAQSQRQEEFYAFLASSGFEAEILVYGNILVSRPTQLINKDGALYRVKPNMVFPYQLTGVWATDSPDLLAIIDDRMEIIHPSTEFTPSLLDDPAGVTSFYNQLAADSRSVGLLRGAGAWSVQDGLSLVKARMAAGENVLIACLGDSTTDGLGTTGYVANTVGNAGNLSPNSWPYKLQILLRDMYAGNHIKVFNAGFSGRKLVDGWAYTNYAAAVVNNTNCGVPDICFVAFGLNDITEAGSQIAAFARETRKLCARMLLAGTVPVLVSCDPHYRVDSDKDNKESGRQLDAVKRSIAAEMNVPFFDISEAIKKWLSVNADNIRWGTIQPDALHLNDIGHAFKASWFAKELFDDTYAYGGGDEILPAQDSRSNPALPSGSTFKLTNNRQGLNYFAEAQNPSVAQLTAWVWNEHRDTKLVYLGVGEERVIPSTTIFPRIVVTDSLDGSQVTKRPAMATPSARTWLSSDIPADVCFLKYGLSKVQYFPSDSPTFYGCFSFIQASRSKRVSAISGIGAIYVSASDKSFVAEKMGSENYFGLVDGDEIVFKIDASIGAGAGIILASCPAFSITEQLEIGTKNVLMVYRSAFETDLAISIGQVKPDGSITEVASRIVTTIDIPVTTEIFRVSLKVSGGVRQVGGAVGATGPLTYKTLAASDFQFVTGGVVGGVFKQAASATAEVRSILIER